MRQRQEMKLSQQLRVTPQLVQSIRMLTLSAIEFEQTIREAIEDNVMLEAEEPAATAEAEAIGGDWSGSGGWSDGDSQRAGELSPRVRLLDQILAAFPDTEHLRIALALYDEIDDAGYIASDLETVATDIRRAGGRASGDDVHAVLMRIQRMEPTGIAARGLAECLALQVDALPVDEPGRALARRLVTGHLEALGAGDRAALLERLGCDDDELSAALSLIRGLDPKPGADPAPAQAIIPDLRVDRVDGEWVVRVNSEALPRLGINAAYEQWLKGSDDSSGATTLRNQLQEARWLLRSVEMRQTTLLKTGRAIFERQAGFLEAGEIALRPMTLREVSEAIGMHESSVCRIVRGKYIQTPRGIFELRGFFSSQVGDGAQQDVSGAAVRAMIQKLVAEEVPARPLCDSDIAATLARRGVKVARRTIAKYRNALGIPPAAQRGACGAAASV